MVEKERDYKKWYFLVTQRPFVIYYFLNKIYLIERI